ncbi:DUF3078 domain-containing protein [Flavobacterium sp. GCM10023249]|uniref:DUF3078 domain-containing protein n=1 Tax=unclassified Flavobacterium TaxID=196869 RepID=UPI0036126BE9
MKPKVIFPVVLLAFTTLTSLAQDKITTKLPDSTTYWKKHNKVGFDISETAFMNWNAGGNNSISGLLKLNFIRKYEYENLKWHNELIVRYGVNKQDGTSLRKTDDALQFNSTFGFRRDTISNWFYSAKLNFNTQFTNGYSYPDTETAISRFFAPAYIFLGVGTEYISKEDHLKLYLSPLTQKTTLVLNQRLANEGAFGVKKAVYDEFGNLVSEGHKSRTEVGVLLTGQHKDEIFKNIYLENRVALYSDYLNNFGNIDVNWQLQLDLIVNEYVSANIGTHLIYDDDIKAKEEENGEQITVGPKIQLKQVLGIGLTYTF